ncbi:MAG TPA: zf-HC2 domain-containing protein [Burkholderiales bacterium]|jgi:predicted anti-sigma-YlaC factor YlaD|nr:zf-HC2 domain-containing protein [Burkholderiales bacterium]
MKMLSCREATRLLSQGLDRELALGERIALRVHLAICAGCRNVDRQLAFLRRAVRRLPASDDGLSR